MAFVLLIIGAVLLTAAVRDTQDSLFSLAQGEFTGTNNFIYWFAAIFLIGAIGYIPKLKPISVGFLTLVIIVLALKAGNPSNTGGGFFAELTAALNTTTTAAPAPASSAPGVPASTATTVGSVSNVGNILAMGIQ